MSSFFINNWLLVSLTHAKLSAQTIPLKIESNIVICCSSNVVYDMCVLKLSDEFVREKTTFMLAIL